MAVDPLSLPFKEAITFLRGKVSMPSKSWKDFQKEQHDTAFVVAGAMKADLLADFRNAVDKAIAEGKSMQWFQEQFDTIVSRHGWKFYGDRTWRAETIMGTNLRAAYAAGRYAQMTEPAFLKRNPYWEWRHGDSVRPRPQHLAWNGMVLRADDPFWTAHYPPCGWGCKCKAFALADDDVRAEGLKVLPGAPPPIAPASSGEVIPGVDKGWDYTPGATVAGRLRPVMERKMDNLPPKISEALRKEIGGYLRETKGPPKNPILGDNPKIMETRLSLDASALKTWLAKPSGDFEIMSVPADIAAALGAKTTHVIMSMESGQKNITNHPDLSLVDHLLLPFIGDHPSVVIKDKARAAVLLKTTDGKIYHAAIKATQSGETLFLTSFRRTNELEAAKVLKRGTIISGSWPEK